MSIYYQLFQSTNTEETKTLKLVFSQLFVLICSDLYKSFWVVLMRRLHCLVFSNF